MAGVAECTSYAFLHLDSNGTLVAGRQQFSPMTGAMRHLPFDHLVSLEDFFFFNVIYIYLRSSFSKNLDELLGPYLATLFHGLRLIALCIKIALLYYLVLTDQQIKFYEILISAKSDKFQALFLAVRYLCYTKTDSQNLIHHNRNCH